MEQVIRPKKPRAPRPRSVARKLIRQYQRPVLYVILSLLVFGGLALLAAVMPETLLTYALLQAGFLLAGILHLFTMYAVFEWAKREAFWPTTLFTLALSGVGILCFFLLPAVFGLSPPPSGFFLAAFTFLLPYFFIKAFDSWRAIPGKKYKQWFFPVNIEPPVMELTDTINLNIFLPIQTDDERYSEFSVRAPRARTLEELIHFLIFKYNTERSPETPIEVADGSNQRPYGWHFYTEPAWFRPRKYLDPQLSIEELNLGDESVIVAQRLVPADSPRQLDENRIKKH